MVDLVDKSLFVIAFAFPILAVIRWDVRGIWIGAAAQWAALAIAGRLLALLDPASRTGFTAIFDGLWLLLGWAFALGYAGLVLGIKRLWLTARRARVGTRGTCPACGYDLRATAQGGRCPECGRQPSS